jgi:membrane protein CcdC involved in cytochrome C biogenesis
MENRHLKKGGSLMSNNSFSLLTNAERRELRRLEKIKKSSYAIYIVFPTLVVILVILAIIVAYVGRDKNVWQWQGLLWLASFVMICFIAIHKQLKLYKIIKKLQGDTVNYYSQIFQAGD